ncbi:Demethylmenaquinone methyltransferase [Rhynchospora pubera]|uniref:Demethylmenaquinone methyltransferase n=1 Tax=Rhynchospora pubera TaxID=906938 RepID=A0AAV8BRM5_9POAL|nr:Demethylmenaquinone methyltransferase [Rhynchospora pubera]
MAGAVRSISTIVPRRCLALNRGRGAQRFPRPFVLMAASRLPAAASPSASSTVEETSQIQQDIEFDEKTDPREDKLACPICYYPLMKKSDESVPRLQCNVCKKEYRNNGTYLDLTVSASSGEYTESMPAATELFRSPLVSFLYERGWRQNFIWGGFPGPEKEFEMAKEYLQPAIGGTIVDASCGSGLFSRLFVKSGMFSQVIALDFSENMLRQCSEFVENENLPKENLALVRADISRLPFPSGSIDAIHAGAALHCWPSPASAVAEISRVLRPGGVFVATTFIVDVVPPAVPALRLTRQYFAQFTSNTIYVSETELEDLCSACGLVGFTCARNGFFVMISVTKPS